MTTTTTREYHILGLVPDAVATDRLRTRLTLHFAQLKLDLLEIDRGAAYAYVVYRGRIAPRRAALVRQFLEGYSAAAEIFEIA